MCPIKMYMIEVKSMRKQHILSEPNLSALSKLSDTPELED